MPFKFTWICDLLQAIEDIECRDPSYLPDRKRTLLRTTVKFWFRKHRQNIDRPDTDGAAILSTLLPHTRTDRVYSVRAPKLEKLIGRCLYYKTDKVKDLSCWREPGAGDLGQRLECIEKPLDWEPLPGPGVLAVEDVDAGLADIASRCRFSSPVVQKHVSAEIPVEILKPLLLRMHSREKKWFVRLMLKDFGRVILDDDLVLGEFHFMLPSLLKFQNDFAAAMALLKGPLTHYHAKPDRLSQKLLLEQAAQHLKPRVGIKIGRPTWYKARSISNCLQMVGDGTWIIERKYDGEFCEIHVDLSKTDNIQIFSKNGKDATNDRKSLLPAIKDSLRIGSLECQFRTKCILLGEMVVFNQLDNQVSDFDKIRKHVSRSGSFLGTDRDSQPHSYENLMIYYFDVLLVDDEITMALPHIRRRKRLSEVIRKIEGRAKTVEWKALDFSESEAKKTLVFQFSAALTYRCEGLILKPNAPFFSLIGDRTNGGWCRGFIKLKKDYMTDMGGARDVADFAVVAASYDVGEAQKCKLPEAKWTNFYLGCLVDNDDRYQDRPKFKVVAVTKATHCVPPKELEFLNRIGKFHGKEYDHDERIEQFSVVFGRNPLPSLIFTEPLVVEVLGSSFEKPPNEDFHMLRHPRILRTHMDRSWEDCITMQGLADMAREAKEAPADGESQELKNQVQRFMEKIGRSRERSSLASRHTTPRSAGISTSPLATLKSVSPVYGLDTPVQASSHRKHFVSSPASAKTPSPATALIKDKKLTLRTSVTVDFAKEVTPVSQQSTQWTETIVTPVASARQSVRRPQPTISPPRRGVNVSDTVNREEITLSPSKEPPTRVAAEDAPCSGDQNTNRLRNPRLDPPRHTGMETTKTAAGAPENAKDVSSDLWTVPEEEVSFYEERGAMSVKQQTGGLKTQQLRMSLPKPNGTSRNATQLIKPLASPKLTRWRSPAITRPPSTGLLTERGKLSPQQKKDAEDVIARQRALKLTASAERSMEPEEELPVQAKALASVQAYMLPPIRFIGNKPLLTPPTSFINEPSSANNAHHPQPKHLPASPPSSSPPNPPSATTTPRASRLKENVPPPTKTTTTTHHRLAKRRAADDLDIDVSPRKIPKWTSPVYGRPRLPPPQPPKPNLPPLPYNLAATCVYIASSLQRHACLTRTLLSEHFGVGALVFDLEDWRRGDGLVYESMGSTVGKSQAFGGLRKVCLVEREKRAECGDVVKKVREVLAGSGGKRDKVGVFDWRVVEDLVEGEEGVRVDEGWEVKVWRERVYAVV